MSNWLGKLLGLGKRETFAVVITQTVDNPVVNVEARVNGRPYEIGSEPQYDIPLKIILGAGARVYDKKLAEAGRVMPAGMRLHTGYRE